MPRAAAVDLSDDTRTKIVKAALTAFTEKGFDGASTRDITTRAKVNHGLIPYYFKTKEKLWQAAVDLAFGDMKNAIDRLLVDATVVDTREQTGALVRAHVRYIAEHPEFVRLMYEEGKRRGPRMRWLVDRHVKPMYEMIAALLSRSGPAGHPLSNVAPVHFFYIMAGSTGLIFHQAEECKRVTGIDPFDPAVVEEHARVVELLLLGPA